MKKLLPEAVVAIMDQLDRDGMAFQNYKLCGSPFQAVLVLRFTCQKLHLPWLDLETKKPRAAESTSTASAPSSHSETQATSYMAMPGFDHHCTKAEGKSWHDSGVDLTNSDNHEEFDRFMPKGVIDGPLDKKVSVVCNTVTRSNIAPNKPLGSSSSSGTHDASCDDLDDARFVRDHHRSVCSNAFVQTDLDFEYMKKIMDEINNREYVPSDTPFSHLRLDKKDKSTLSHSQHIKVAQRNRECQTDCQIAGIDTMLYAAPHKHFGSNGMSPQLSPSSPVNFHGGRQEFRCPVARPVPCHHIGVQVTLEPDRQTYTPLSTLNTHSGRREFRNTLTYNVGVQTVVYTYNEGTQTHGSPMTTVEADKLLTSINKAIQTAGYIEEYIHNTPGRELFQQLNVNNGIEIDDRGIHPFRSASACSLRAPQDEMLRSSSSCSNITVQEEVIRPQSAFSERTRTRHLFDPSPMESLSIASKDLELTMSSETDTEADDETLLTHRERYLMKRAVVKVPACQGSRSDLSSLSSYHPLVDKASDPIDIITKCDAGCDAMRVPTKKHAATDPIKTVGLSHIGTDPIKFVSHSNAGTDPIEEISHFNTDIDIIRTIPQFHADTSYRKGISHSNKGTDPIKWMSHTNMGTDPCFSIEDLVEDIKGSHHNVDFATQTSFVDVRVTTDQTAQTEDNLENNEQEELYDSFAAYIPGYKPTEKKKSNPRNKLTLHSTFSTLVEYEEDSTQTDTVELVTRGVGIRVKQKSDECQTDKYLIRGLMNSLTLSNPLKEATMPQAESDATPKVKKKKARSQSLTLTGTSAKEKKRKKKKKHQELQPLPETLAIPGTSQRLSSSEEYDLQKIYSEEDFKAFVDNLPVRHSPEIVLQKGGSIGVIQGVLKLRSGSPEMGVQALYICVLQEVTIPLYCSGDGHRNCMAGQVIRMDKADWHKAFAILKAKGVFVAVPPGVMEFETAQNCCWTTMAKKAETGSDLKLGRRGSQPNKCANQ